MKVFIWFLEEFPFIYLPVLFFLFMMVLVSGCIFLLTLPVLDYLLDSQGGDKVADDF